ncbi:hypothetical protein RHMOL_Rhmol10G0278300 [Rhododendron molle]|uniref:Uncharacterized protein n=1 Tax=Rhododendron molle TaxID=49168 RepID=A0ACC0M740_RHOML|nr:hypothetical protein RHMOL_Rhmol10G0278300 [Rhododendron molle]
MSKGSLDKHLFGGDNITPLSWNLRHKIISGVASALYYLHNHYNKRVVHRDVKASNIMLDAEFNAKLGDFGLARALDNEKTSYTEAGGVPGTMGYMAPEYLFTGKATEQSDVYAFGAVLFEVVCGHRPGTQIGMYPLLVDWVWALHREGQLLEAVDSRLGEEYVADEAQSFLLLGLACSHPIASERPKTQEIVQMLSGSMPVPHVPSFKPPYAFSPVPMLEEDIIPATTTGTTFFTAADGESESYAKTSLSQNGVTRMGSCWWFMTYMPNGSLDKHLFGNANNMKLSWNLRRKIICGVASTLHYLHNEYLKRVVHCDVKAFLLEVVSGHTRGTQTGMYPLLVDWVWALYREGQLLEAVDNRLGQDIVVEEVQRFLLLGLACSHPTASERPKTQEIV